MPKVLKIAITADPAIPVPPIFYGGIERIIFMLIEELVKEGHDVTLIAHKDSMVPCKLIPYAGKGQSRLDILRNTLTVTKAALSNKFDVVHSFGRLAYLTFLMPFGIRKIMSYQREPTISQIKLAMKIAKKGSIFFTGCSEYIAKQIRPFAPAYGIHNFVDTSRCTFTDKVSPDAPLVFLGRVEYIKGAHVAMQVGQKSGRKVIIAGNVPNKLEHQKYFAEKVKPFIDNDRVQYVGPVNDQQKNELLSKSFAFLMPILWDEPFGIVMAEAIACGTPIVGFKRGAVPEVIEEGINGFIVNNVNEMVAALEKVKGLDRKLSRKVAEEKFDVAVITRQYLEIYKN